MYKNDTNSKMRKNYMYYPLSKTCDESRIFWEWSKEMSCLPKKQIDGEDNREDQTKVDAEMHRSSENTENTKHTEDEERIASNKESYAA